MRRRDFVTSSAVAALDRAHAQKREFPIIDTHIHLFDTARPGGVPWPAKDNAVLYKPALPDRYRALTARFGITGAIEVECSPLVEDNQWVLDIAARDSIIVGTIGNLEPDKPEFAAQLERSQRNPLFRGIRYGNLWGRDFDAAVGRPQFIDGVKRLAAGGLVLDTANPDPALVHDVVRLTDRVPELRVVIDHLPQCTPPPSAADLRELGARKQVFVKLSQIFRRVNGEVVADLAFYRDRLDTLFGTFGEDRVLYGSDWPNSDQWMPYEKVFGLVRDYFESKPRAVQEKYFWKNSLAAYRWVQRKETAK